MVEVNNSSPAAENDHPKTKGHANPRAEVHAQNITAPHEHLDGKIDLDHEHAVEMFAVRRVEIMVKKRAIQCDGTPVGLRLVQRAEQEGDAPQNRQYTKTRRSPCDVS